MVKPTSLKLPLLLGLVVLGAIGAAIVLLLPTDPPPQPNPPAPLLPNDEPPPVDNPDPLVDPDPKPRSQPKPGAPASAALAEEMQAEVEGAMNAIRARLELKYKYAEYKLDPAWTLEQVVRRLETLNGRHFASGDYTLSFPEGEDPRALITCASAKGVALPDGPLTLTLNLRTGESQRAGRILARNADGYVLLGDSQYAEISRVLRSVALQGTIRRSAPDWREPGFPRGILRDDSAFTPADFGMPAETEAVAEFACRTIGGQQLAQPAVVTIDFAARTVKTSSVDSPDWMRPPQKREEFINRARWLMEDVAQYALEQLAAGKKPGEILLEASPRSRWSWEYAEVLPFDVVIAEGSATRVVLETATSFGRSVPFGKVRYVAESAGGTSRFED